MMESYQDYLDEAIDDVMDDIGDSIRHDVQDYFFDISEEIQNYVMDRLTSNFSTMKLIDFAMIIERADELNTLEMNDHLWRDKDVEEALKLKAFYTLFKDVHKEVGNRLMDDLMAYRSELENTIDNLEKEEGNLVRNDTLTEQEAETVEELKTEIDSLYDIISNIDHLDM